MIKVGGEMLQISIDEVDLRINLQILKQKYRVHELNPADRAFDGKFFKDEIARVNISSGNHPALTNRYPWDLSPGYINLYVRGSSVSADDNQFWFPCENTAQAISFIQRIKIAVLNYNRERTKL